MLGYALRRVALAICVAWTVSVLTFALLGLAGDPAIAIAGSSASAEDIALVRQQYGLDQPLIVQYGIWLLKALQGDLGQSLMFRTPVSSVIASRLPVTMLVGVCAILFALAIAIPLGVMAATRPNTLLDRTSLTISVVGQAMPSFWFALMLIVVFSVELGWLPASGLDSWWGLILPTVVLGYYAMPAIFRLTRAGMMDVLSSDFIRTTRAMGLHPASILLSHALRNAILPVVSLAAVQFGYMLNGSIVVESIFGIKGLGYLGWESISGADIPVVQGVVLVFCCIYVVLALLADLLNAWLDPRLRKLQYDQ